MREAYIKLECINGDRVYTEVANQLGEGLELGAWFARRSFDVLVEVLHVVAGRRRRRRCWPRGLAQYGGHLGGGGDEAADGAVVGRRRAVSARTPLMS